MNVFPRQISRVALLVVAIAGSVAYAGPFDPLFQLGKVTGPCFVRRPGIPDFEAAIEGRAYPFGSEVRTQADADIVLHLSPTVQLRLGAGSTAVVGGGAAADSMGRKVVTLSSGMLGVYSPYMEDREVILPLVVETALARFENFRGRVQIRLAQVGDANRATVTTAIGDAKLEGPQFGVERLGRSASLEITTAFDESFTSLSGKSGEYEVLVERGSQDPSVVAFRSGAKAKIWRRRASVSDRLAVSVMISGAEGNVTESFAYLQGEEVLTESIRAPQDGTGLGDAIPSAFDDALFDQAPVPVLPGGDTPGLAPQAEPETLDNWGF